MRINTGNTNWIFLAVIQLLFSTREKGTFSAGNLMTWFSDKLIILPGIVIGLSMHEFAHAAVAYKLGDNTPKLQGRVTINPLAHIDWLGFIALFLCGFGWGKPVQINQYNFKHIRRDELFVALAGVVMNLLIAVLFTIILKLITVVVGNYALANGMGQIIWYMLLYTVQINLVLMVFNLIPVPPLDGFNVIAQIGGFGQSEVYWKIYRYGSWILIAIIVFGVASKVIAPIVNALMNLIWTIIF